MNHVIITKALTKQYGSKRVVNQLDLRVPEGSIYGFLGPNGAGKSTTIKLLLGLIKPTGGNMKLLGKEITKKNRLYVLSRTGSLIEAPAYYGHLSGYENLRIVCTLKNIPESDIDRVLKIVRMDAQKEKKVRHYSLGMKQRLGLAAALIGSPRLLLLDEPTNGLDPAGIQEMRELICSLPKQYGITVLVSSHLLSEIDQMATDVGILDKGQLIFQDSLSCLHEQSKSGLILRTDNDPKAAEVLNRLKIPWEKTEGTLYLHVREDAVVINAIASLVDSGIGILRLSERQMSLEDIYLHLTGKKVSL